jgi:hypothetical protein
MRSPLLPLSTSFLFSLIRKKDNNNKRLRTRKWRSGRVRGWGELARKEEERGEYAGPLPAAAPPPPQRVLTATFFHPTNPNH